MNIEYDTHNITCAQYTYIHTMNKYLFIDPTIDNRGLLYRVSNGTKLILKPAPTLRTSIVLKTNYPQSGKFNRSKYYDIKISADHQDVLSSCFNWQACLDFTIAGTFHIRASDKWECYIVVEPRLDIRSLRCQTHLTKNLGPLTDWPKSLELAKDCGYNLLHFTPIQELGFSGSAYSIKDNLKISPSLNASLDDIKKQVECMQKKWQTLSITDIVLNHVSSDCEWIHDIPAGTYNLENCKYLRPAFLLDLAIRWLNEDICSGVLKHTHSIDGYVKSDKDVNAIIALLRSYYVPSLRIYEMYFIDVEKASKKIYPSGNILVKNHYTRYGTEVVCAPETNLKDFFKKYNLEKKKDIENHLDSAINNVRNSLAYERLNPTSSNYQKPLSLLSPIVAPYFTFNTILPFNVTNVEEMIYTNGAKFMANNGWVMGFDPTEDFAAPHCLVYLRRELVSWGDCIKLRYGESPEDAPELWKRMKSYIESQARVFHGFRLDNCHSTPIAVAEYMIDAARAIRPDLYILAELFTNAEETDNVFVNRLGLTALVREAMNANDCRDFGRLLYRYGGLPVGSFEHHGSEILRPGVAHAMFYDQTHDNQCLVAKLPYHPPGITSLLSMAICTTGSTRCYDEFVPHSISVVDETRLYNPSPNIDLGLIQLRKILNIYLQRHLQGFTEIFVDQVDEGTIAISRHNPTDGKFIILITRFSLQETRVIPIEGKLKRILFESIAKGDPHEYTRNDTYINGLTNFRSVIETKDADPRTSKFFSINEISNNSFEITLDKLRFLPSCVVALEVTLSEAQSCALKELNNWQIDLSKLNLSLLDANYILFRCEQEDGYGTYNVPNFCQFTYCGLYGLMYHLEKIRENNDQGHPLAKNLRDGDWLSNYIIERLKKQDGTLKVAQLLDPPLKLVNILPRGMVPKYFDIIITRFYNNLLEMIYSKMSSFISKGPQFVKLLSLSSIAVVGNCNNAALPEVEKDKIVASISAGLPHFSSGFMRNWGRDTFISLRGLLLVTGRYTDAKNIILSYGRTLDNGLIPNLLDGGKNSRYNCRDAVWWWLYSIKEYVNIVPNGADILKSTVQRIYKPMSQITRRKSSGLEKGQPLYDVMQEALEVHFQGIEFVEKNAGKKLDEHMQTKGFTVTAGVDRDTGFVYGGNQWNCGTWMDKMGSSEKAGNKGVPASPRDGSAVELVCLSYAVVCWLEKMFKASKSFPYDGVECLYDRTITLKWTWKKWAGLIKENFEKFFYIPQESNCDHVYVDLRNDLINKRGIYKDTYKATVPWQDYQLRPNFVVGIVVAPDLFDAQHAQSALLMAKKHLVSKLGVKTLDPDDWNYSGDYDNSNDTTDRKLAAGFNYHQGPEWLWLTGFYLRASSKFLGETERTHHMEILANLHSQLISSPWLGLPELTNSNGRFCKDSCPIQAWSLATTLEALYESVRY